MIIVEASLIVVGSILSILAGVGLLRLDTTYARFHAAGKASPIAFLFIAFGVSLQTGTKGAALLFLAVVALIITLPLGMHLLFRAAHKANEHNYLETDELPRDNL